MEMKAIEILLEIAEAVKNLPFGQHVSLPWCRESFKELDAAMKKFEEITRK